MANLKPLHCLNLDKNQQKNFINYYKCLGEKPSTTVRFFDRSDYYSVHGEDAELAAKIVFKSTALVKIMSTEGSDELKYIVLSKNNFENLAKELLLVKNYRIEVYTSQKSRSNDWALEYKGSPGNLLQFEELLFTNCEMITGSAIIAVNSKHDGRQRNIGVACIETTDRTFSLTEFVDDDFFTELEAIVVLLSPKECLLPSKEGDYSKIKELMERNGVMITIRKKSEFMMEKSEIIQDLNELLMFQKGQKENANTLLETTKAIALSALGVAIKYLELRNDSTNGRRYELKFLELNRFVHLDAAAVSALNILPKPGTLISSPSYKWQSILGVLDRCRTPQGHRLMAQWLKQPLRNAATIKDRHDIVECLMDSVNARNELHDDYLKRMPDIVMLCKKLTRSNASLQDIFRLYQVILRMPKLLQILDDLENTAVKSILFEPMRDTLGDLIKFKQMVEQILDIDGIEKGEFFVKASFDDNLQEMKERMDSIEMKIHSLLSKVADDLNLQEGSSIKLDTVSHIGFHFRISLKDDAVLRKNNKYETIDAIKGGVRFTTEKLKDLNEDFTTARDAYEEQQKSIVVEVIRITLDYLVPLICLNNEIAQLDCLVSFAVAAASAPIPYVRPKIYSDEDCNERILEFKQLRHPCLELQDDVAFIANDIAFRKDETQMFIITGPNMGGKSTYIRSVGTAVLMAHVGSFVPCEEARISITDSILGRVGAGDCLTKGLSTFMVEMIETAGIIRTATDKSLVIIDELGRGTSTYEGCGIAWSIAEYLAKETKCFTLFATHFHEITELAQSVPTVKNSHMVAITDNDNFTLLYQVRPGVMDKSFGIHVAKLANFPDNVVQLAQKIYDESEDHYSQLKSEVDETASKLFLETVEHFSSLDDANDEDIIKAMVEINEKVKLSKSGYFKAAFPSVFEKA